MHHPFISGLLFGLLITASSSGAEALRWKFDRVDSPKLTRYGAASPAEGVVDGSLVLDGHSVFKVKDSSGHASCEPGFTLSLWVNPYRRGGDQQMLAAKNCYSLGQRQWGVMVDKDGRFRLYLWQGKWLTIDGPSPALGHWHLVGVVVRPSSAELWVNGKRSGSVKLAKPIVQTEAPITFGAVDDNGRVWQNFYGALDDAHLVHRPVSADVMSQSYNPFTKTHEVPKSLTPINTGFDPTWAQRIDEHRQLDRSVVIFDGKNPDRLACDTTLRKMPDGSWVMIMLGGGNTEPLPQNRVFISRSQDQGKTWSDIEPIDLGIKSKDPSAALVPSELMVYQGRCTLFVATHNGGFGNWKEWMTHSDDSCRNWSPLEPAPGRLKDRTFIRNHIVTADGRILLPFQHYMNVDRERAISGGRRFSPPLNPRNGVLMSDDGGKTWTEHGDIRISSNDRYHGWAENNIVELSDQRIAMIIRADRLGGVLYYAESHDGGRTWPEVARKTSIPNPGSKATLYGLGGDRVALLHNPNPRHRSPLALWVSFDAMKSWPYQRVLVPESIDGPQGRLNYPDGFVSDDRRQLHFAFDDNRHRGVMVSATLPTAESPTRRLWQQGETLPPAEGAEVLTDVAFHVIKRWEPEVDQYRWLHGVAMAHHKGRLYASFGHNQGAENTVTEIGRFCTSDDGGKTWSVPSTIDQGTDSEDLAVSHGVFLSRGEELWAFLGAFHNSRKRVHTRGYQLDESTGIWKAMGTVVSDGFWPMTEPAKMPDGNWIMPGFIVGGGNPPAVAISHGDDLARWDLRMIPRGPGTGKMWGESTVVVDGEHIVNIARYGDKALALVATSDDCGRNWSTSVESDLPMATSKPCAGMLTTGQRYLICTTTADSGGRRSPLTIAVTRPGEHAFSKVFVIRHAEFSDGPGESHPAARLSYPYATEHSGKLYVGYSNSGNRGGNHNSAELAIIPIETLAAD